MDPSTIAVQAEDGTLKSCPFCGEKSELYPGYRTRRDADGMIRPHGPPYDIDCLGCGITVTPRDGMDAIEAWNRRAE